MSEPKHTPGPWVWRELGGEWHLVRDTGPRLIVLTTLRLEAPDNTILAIRDETMGTLVPFVPNHPDARLIASAPDLLALLEECYDSLPLGDLTDRIAKTLCKAKGN